MSIYPPQINTYQPSFIVSTTGSFRINFSYSDYLSNDDIVTIKEIQISIKNQKTNKNVLKDNPLGILNLPLERIDNKPVNYIDIPFEDCSLISGQYYKVQLRFSTKENLPKKPNYNTLITYANYFSEWSTYTIIKGFTKPNINVILNPRSIIPQVEISINFDEKDINTEYIKKYKIGVYHLNTNNKICETDYILTDTLSNLNNIKYTFSNVEFPSKWLSSNYVKFYYITNNNYSGVADSKLTKITPSSTKLINPFDISFKNDNKNGRMIITTQYDIEKNTDNKIIGYQILRSSNLDNFVNWETVIFPNYKYLTGNNEEDNLKNNIYYIPIEADKDQYINYDYTIENSIFYVYKVVAVDEDGQLSSPVGGWASNSTKSDNELAVSASQFFDFKEAYIIGQNKVLSIPYNFEVNSYKIITLESKNDTLGGKYPIIQRNGNTYYRQLGISGLISFVDYTNTELVQIEDSIGNTENKMDTFQNNLFITKNELFNNNLVQTAREDRISNYSMLNDTMLEREFRNKVMEFLYDENIKLLKTPNEGNLIVKLMDINFTPESNTHNHLYNFSATAYEIADCTMENLEKYKIFIKESDRQSSLEVTS